MEIITEMFPDDREIRASYSTLTRRLIAEKLTITTMESATSGQIASLITDTEGSSAILKGAYITYSNEAKIMQGVPAEIIEKYGVYSKETASAMAEAARQSMHADLAIGVTGSMGNVDPANADSVPGQVYYAIAGKTGTFSWFAELPVQPTRLRYKMVVAELVRRKIDQLLPLLTGRISSPDCHMHTTCSDGTDSPQGIIQKVMEAGIDFFSVTDHDCFDGCIQAKKWIEKMGQYSSPNPNEWEGEPAEKGEGGIKKSPIFINGIEFSCRDRVGKYHILGYAFDEDAPSMREAVNIVHTARRQKTVNRFCFLEERGYTFTEEEKQQMFQRENPGKPHFVNLLLEKGYVSSKEEGFALMDQYHGKERKLTAEEAIHAILAAGGIPVLAHGIHEQGDKHLTEEETEERVCHLISLGLQGVECYYSTYTPQEKEIMLNLAEGYHLLITAGSDYHGSNKKVRLGETNQPDMEKMMPFFAAVMHNIVEEKTNSGTKKRP